MTRRMTFTSARQRSTRAGVVIMLTACNRLSQGCVPKVTSVNVGRRPAGHGQCGCELLGHLRRRAEREPRQGERRAQHVPAVGAAGRPVRAGEPRLLVHLGEVGRATCLPGGNACGYCTSRGSSLRLTTLASTRDLCKKLIHHSCVSTCLLLAVHVR